MFEGYIDVEKITRSNGKGYQELKVLAGQEYLVRIYTDRSEFDSWLRRTGGGIDQNTNLIVLTSFPGPYATPVREDLIKNILKENYGLIAYYSWIQLPYTPNVYYDTIRSPISFLITAAFQHVSRRHKVNVRKLDLSQEREEDFTKRPEDQEDAKDELDLKKRAKELLATTEQITRILERRQLIDELNSQTDTALIRQIMSWALLTELLDSSLNIEHQIRFWAGLLSETLHTPSEVSTKTPSKLKDEVSQFAKKLKAIEENHHPKLSELLSDWQKYWEAIDLLKTITPELGQLFPVDRKQVSELIEKIKNTDLFCPDDVYGLVRGATRAREMLSTTGIEVGSLKKLKRGLSPENFELVIKILKDRKHIPLSELKIDQLSEIMKELPEILKVIVLSLHRL